MSDTSNKAPWLKFGLTFGVGIFVGVIAGRATRPEPSKAEAALNALGALTNAGVQAAAELNKDPEVKAVRNELMKTGMSLISDSMKREMAAKKAEAEQLSAMTPLERREFEAAKSARTRAERQQKLEQLQSAGEVAGSGANFLAAMSRLNSAQKEQALSVQGADDAAKALQAAADLSQAAIELERAQQQGASAEETMNEANRQLEALQRLQSNP